MKLTVVVISVVATAGLGVGAAAMNNPASDREPAPGPNGANTHGLCTAYFAGSAKALERKRQAPPFRALEEAAGGASRVEAYCEEHDSKPRD